MGIRSGAGDPKWKLFIGLAAVCGLLVFAAGSLRQRAVTAAVAEQQTKAANYARTQLPDAVAGFSLTKALNDQDAKALSKVVNAPAGADVRIYSLEADAVFSTEGARVTVGDRDAIATAAKGQANHVVDGGDSLSVYAPILGKGDQPLAVVAVVTDYAALQADAAGIFDSLRPPLIGLAVLFLALGLALFVRRARADTGSTDSGEPEQRKAASKQPNAVDGGKAGRATGFGEAPALKVDTSTGSASSEFEGPTETPAPMEAAKQPKAGKAPKEPKVKKSLFARKTIADEAAPAGAVAARADDDAAPALDREVAIREALEDQLAQLRTAMRLQEEQSAQTSRQLTEQLDVMTLRAEAAEGHAQPGPAKAQPQQPPQTTGPAERDMMERLQRMESELAQARIAAAEAASADVRVEEAQKVAAESEQRAASIESVRGELEVRVAQLGSKAGELEQKATDLEARLQEANAGGDAVRAEIASLTAALASSNARVEELEAVDNVAPSVAEFEASTSEVARLRAELANQLERSQAAEERAAALEADVFAARQGVQELPIEGSAVEAETVSDTSEEFSAVFAPIFAKPEVPPAPSDEDRYDDVWSTAFPTPAATVGPGDEAPADLETEASPPEDPDDEPSPEQDTMSPEDDLWALRERLAHATNDREGLRERLAHASEDTEEPDGSTSAPRWG